MILEIDYKSGKTIESLCGDFVLHDNCILINNVIWETGSFSNNVCLNLDEIEKVHLYKATRENNFKFEENFRQRLLNNKI